MAIEVFNRYEHKYLINLHQFDIIKRLVEQYMVLDAYNKNYEPYTISNLYFDTTDDFLIRTSLGKPKYKEKLRMRAYGIPKADAHVFLEIKKKFKGLVNKRRTELKLGEAYEFVKSKKAPKLKPYMNVQVLHEIEYFMSCYELSPKVYIAYDRIAYFDRADADLRISFDFNIRSRRHDLALESGDVGSPLLPGTMCLMEIKTATAKPLWITHMLASLDITRTSFSKYGTEFKHSLENNNGFYMAI